MVTNQIGHFETVHARHFDIQQHQIRSDVFKLLDRIHTIFGSHNIIALTFKQTRRHFTYSYRVIDNHYQTTCICITRTITLIIELFDTLCRLNLTGNILSIENQTDLTITQNRSTGHHSDIGKLLSNRFHHNLRSRTDQLIDQ